MFSKILNSKGSVPSSPHLLFNSNSIIVFNRYDLPLFNCLNRLNIQLVIHKII
nr:MAG TPA: hypothetical protein [Caudoviricetes sp.]